MANVTVNKLRRNAADGGFGSVKEYLESIYKDHPLSRIAEQFEMSKSGVHRLMQNYKVQMRGRGGANRS